MEMKKWNTAQSFLKPTDGHVNLESTFYKYKGSLMSLIQASFLRMQSSCKSREGYWCGLNKNCPQRPLVLTNGAFGRWLSHGDDTPNLLLRWSLDARSRSLGHKLEGWLFLWALPFSFSFRTTKWAASSFLALLPHHVLPWKASQTWTVSVSQNKSLCL